MESISKGVAAYDFELPSVEDKLVSLQSLRGKVVLVDFWFTGCSACKAFAGSLEKAVIPQYSDTSVAFVSICLDKDKNKWLKSVDQGGYTTARSINLYTEGRGFEHPLVRFYNISSCPFLLLIDREGNIISSTVPRTSKELCFAIDEALKK